MTEVRMDPRQYLALPLAAFWRWDQDAVVLSWAQSQATIAFRSELEQILRMMLRDGFGLPPLSLVLLVLAATRDSWARTIQDEREVVRQFAAKANVQDSDFLRLQHGLGRVAALPADLRHSIESKSQLLEFLFETGGACCVGEGAQIVCDTLSLGQASLSEQATPDAAATEDVCRAFPLLLGGLERLDKGKLKLRSDTGLDALLLPAELPVAAWKAARELVDSLREDEMYSGLARLARALMAVVHLPRPLLEPEELPLGGFSDIENRGSLDRLLTSELAHDELTLVVRIALGEALYLRRETPPKTPSLARSILIDVGIRMWGLPRLFGTAVALALVATAEHHSAVTVYRAKGAGVEPVDLTTRAGLIDHLMCLEPDTHAGQALPAFFEATDRQLARSDRVVVTSVEGARDPDFLRCDTTCRQGDLFLATVDSHGGFHMSQRGPHGSRSICEAQLDVDKILASPADAVPLLDSQRAMRVPAIFRQASFPLRVPCNRFNELRSWICRQGVYEISADQRLLYWDHLLRGPRQIADYVPCDMQVCWGNIDAGDERAVAVLGRPGRRYQLLEVPGSGGSIQLTRIDLQYPVSGPAYSFAQQGNMLLAIRGSEVIAFRADGMRVNHFSARPDRGDNPPPLSHVQGRYFVDDSTGTWFRLSIGTPHHFTPVFDPATDPSVKLMTIVDCARHEGPVGLTEDGCLYFCDQQLARPIRADRGFVVNRVLDVSPCGEWIEVELTMASGRYRALISLANETAEFAPQGSARRRSIRRYVLQGNDKRILHRRFISIGATEDGSALALVSTKGLVWLIELRGGAIWLRANVRAASEMKTPLYRFDQQVHLPRCGYKLQMAAGASGSRFFIDSRGLLHLCSEQLRIPDTTLILVDGEMAGWCDGGRLWGNPFFTGATSRKNPREVYETVIEPLADLLRT